MKGKWWGVVVNKIGRLGLTYIHYYKIVIKKDLLYSTGNFSQYSVMTYMGK